MRTAPLALAVLAAAVTTSCSGKQERAQASCAKEAVRAQASPLRQPLHGDADGNGEADSIAVVSLAHARAGCHFFVAVHTPRPTTVTPVYRSNPNEEAPSLAPTIGLLAPIDKRPGLEIVAVTGHGASSSHFAVFTVRNGAVVKLSCGACDHGGEFFEDHALMHFATVDCVHAGGGVIAQVFGENVIRSDRWSTEVRIYRVDGDVFRPTVKRQFVTRVPSYGPPFANCPGDRF